MADVPVTIYKSRKVRPGFGPTTPDYPADEDPIIVNPPGSIGGPIQHNSTLNKQGGDPTNGYFGHNSEDIQDALEGSASPSSSNVFATMADVGGGGGLTGSGTANEIAYFTGATALASLPVATYPSLTELSYVKGVTNPIQAQINGKQATIAGTLTNGHVATVVAGVPTWAAPSSGSNWTVVGSDIYRNSAVVIGQTTIPTEATFAVKSKAANTSDDFIQFINAAGATVLFMEDSGDRLIIGNPLSPLSAGFQFKGNATTSGNLFTITNGANSNVFGIIGTGEFSFTSTIFKMGVPSSPLTTGPTWKVTGSGGSTKIWRIDNGSNVEIFSMLNGGTINMGAAANFVLGTTTGTKIGTATSQKLAFWNKTPIIQPTTAITAGAFVSNTSGTLNDSATYGGYTIGQIAAALINSGLLA